MEQQRSGSRQSIKNCGLVLLAVAVAAAPSAAAAAAAAATAVAGVPVSLSSNLNLPTNSFLLPKMTLRWLLLRFSLPLLSFLPN